MFAFRRPAPSPVIRFSCEPRDDGVIAPPVPARTHLPDWFRKLPAVDPSVESRTNTGLTVKRCMPFLDAMATGWLLTLGATVRLEIAEAGARVDASWEFDRPMVANHGAHQVKGHPAAPRPPCKFLNYWTISTPPGWSCLFVPPLNRPNGVFEIVAGVVDTDTYRAPVHLPFFATGDDGLHVIGKGTPLAQVIPFRRDAAEIAVEIGPERPEEAALRDRITRNTRAATGWYRTEARARR
jgi:hypothetical protein